MNKENLLKMAEHLEKNVSQEIFSMQWFRYGQDDKPECDSIGCIIGHCTILEQGELPMTNYDIIAFGLWSASFTGIDRYSDEWNYLFGGRWVRTDNTLEGAIERIRHVVEFGFPDNIWDQINGDAPLSYNI